MYLISLFSKIEWQFFRLPKLAERILGLLSPTRVFLSNIGGNINISSNNEKFFAIWWREDYWIFWYYYFSLFYLGKISFSSNLFISKENELLNKSLDYKRSGFIIFSCPDEDPRLKSHIVQEKINEIIRSSSDSNSKSDVFLFFRILLVKFNEDSLLSLWPLISAELVSWSLFDFLYSLPLRWIRKLGKILRIWRNSFQPSN